MSIDQPTQLSDAAEISVYKGAGAKLQTDAAPAANPAMTGPEKNAALEANGVLPKVSFSEKEQAGAAQFGGATNEHRRFEHHHGQQGPGGHHGRGEHHGFGKPEEQLVHNEIKSLSPEEKAQFKAEGKAAHEYRTEMAAWRKGGKEGPEPTKPNIPEHDKIAAKVKADREGIEEKVRAKMSPEEVAAVEAAKTKYRAEIKENGGRKGVPVPEELRAYERAMGHATRQFIRVNDKPA